MNKINKIASLVAIIILILGFCFYDNRSDEEYVRDELQVVDVGGLKERMKSTLNDFDKKLEDITIHIDRLVIECDELSQIITDNRYYNNSERDMILATHYFNLRSDKAIAAFSVIVEEYDLFIATTADQLKSLKKASK